MSKTAIALGFFDGVHLGHRAILRAAVEQAERAGLEPVALTFDLQPRSYFAGLPGEYLTTREEKIAAMTALGIRRVEVLPFGELHDMPAEDFVRDILVKKLRAAALVCGDDYRFGARAAGSADLLRAMGLLHGFDLTVCPPVEQGGRRVSSTRIREALQFGRVEEVTACLGRPYAITGEVRHGKGLGHQLGFATLNLHRDPELIRPRLGVYAADALVDGRHYAAAVNIGIRPSFDDGDGLTVEAHLPGFSGDVYGQTVTLQLTAFLRDERKFEQIHDLRAQVARDLKEAQELWQI